MKKMVVATIEIQWPRLNFKLPRIILIRIRHSQSVFVTLVMFPFCLFSIYSPLGFIYIYMSISIKSQLTKLLQKKSKVLVFERYREKEGERNKRREKREPIAVWRQSRLAFMFLDLYALNSKQCWILNENENIYIYILLYCDG